MEAIFVKDIKGFTGDARLYKLNPPIEYDGESHKYVIVSATNAMFSGPETYIFPADKKGKIINWGELPGSFQGECNHREALENAGYEITEKE